MSACTVAIFHAGPDASCTSLVDHGSLTCNKLQAHFVLLDGFEGKSLFAKAPGRVFTSVHSVPAWCVVNLFNAHQPHVFAVYSSVYCPCPFVHVFGLRRKWRVCSLSTKVIKRLMAEIKSTAVQLLTCNFISLFVHRSIMANLPPLSQFWSSLDGV